MFGSVLYKKAVTAIIASATAVFFCLLNAQAERLPAKIYTSADGIGTSATFKITRDARGFIWICSRDGLIRFDGYRFINYRIGNAQADPAILDLLPSRKDVYWINLNRGTDYRFVFRGDATPVEPLADARQKNDLRVPLAVEPLKNFPDLAFEDDLGNLWSADNKGIYRMLERENDFDSELTELKFSDFPESALTRVSFQKGSENSFWIGTNWGVVRRLPDGRMIHYKLRPQDGSDPALIFAEDKENRVWITRPDGIIVLKVEPVSQIASADNFISRETVIKDAVPGPNGAVQLPEKPGEAVAFKSADLLTRPARNEQNGGEPIKPIFYGILCASDGRIWVTGSRGLLVFDGKRFEHFNSDNGLGQSPLVTIIEDNDRQLWIASYAGLIRINPKGLVSYGQEDGLTQTRILSIFENPAGELHAITENWNVSRLENGGFKSVRPQIPDGDILAWHSNGGLLDSRGDWWIQTKQSILRYTGVKRFEDLEGRRPTNVYTSKDGLISDSHFRMFEDSKGDVWVSPYPDSKQTGLSRWNRATEKFEQFTPQHGLPDANYASAFIEDRTGTMWVGFNESGMARFKDGKFTFFDEKDGVPAGGIISFFIDSRGRMWIASSIGGLSRIDDVTAERPTFKNYTLADGLTSNNIRCITEDLYGNIYVGTVRGVNRLTPETGRIRYYGTADGLASDFVNVAYRDRSGAIWFGTFAGLSKLIPEPDSPSEPPQISISGLRIAGIDYSVSPLGQNKVLAPEQSADRNNLQIDFFSISTGGEASIRYQYKLEGADADWSAPTANRSVTFANLAPGSYRFLVRAVNSDDVASAAPAIVSFTILRPFWQQWWFLATLAALLALTIYALYRYRLKRVIELERVRTRIATDLHDDIGASLSKIAILSEVVHQRIAPVAANDEEINQPLSEIADTSREMVDSMSDIVWAINPARDSLSDLIHRMRNLAGEMTELCDIGLRVNLIGVEGRELHLGADFRREIYLIFKETINNLIKHSDCSRAEIEFRLEQDNLVIVVKDNGKGFAVKTNGHEENGNGNYQTRGGNGLPNMKRRAENWGGRFEIESVPGKGTTATLRVPLKAHFKPFIFGNFRSK